MVLVYSIWPEKLGASKTKELITHTTFFPFKFLKGMGYNWIPPYLRYALELGDLLLTAQEIYA